MNWSQKFAKSGYKSDYKPAARVVPKCECGLRVRGANHESGAAHNRDKKNK
jgi:hypothetical protein